MINQIKTIFGEVPTDLDSFIIASQIVQAEAKKYFIEFWRMSKFERNGILWWNLRDGWPLISDAIVDYYGSKKLAYQYIKRVQTNVCVMIGDAANKKHPAVVGMHLEGPFINPLKSSTCSSPLAAQKMPPNRFSSFSTK